MKAFVLRAYGSPDVLGLTDIDKPIPGDGEVLVRVRATSVNPYDWHNMRGEPFIARLMGGGLGLRTPKLSILGADMAGEVEAVGEDVTEFRPGDEVFAVLKEGYNPFAISSRRSRCPRSSPSGSPGQTRPDAHRTNRT